MSISLLGKSFKRVAGVYMSISLLGKSSERVKRVARGIFVHLCVRERLKKGY